MGETLSFWKRKKRQKEPDADVHLVPVSGPSSFADASVEIDLPAPFDLDEIAGLGLSERDLKDLSHSRPFGEQHFETSDTDVLQGIAHGLRSGVVVPQSLSVLTYMELELLGIISGRIEEDSEPSADVAGLDPNTIKELIDAEMSRRPT